MKQENDEIVLASELAEEIKKKPEQKTISFRQDWLDKATGGMLPGEFIVVGGEAGDGKTSWCVHLTKKLAEQGEKALWFSCEETYDEFLKRFDPEYNNIVPFYVPRNIPEATMTWIEKKIDEGIEKFGIKFVFIDHIGLIMSEKDYATYRQNSLDVFEERVKRVRQIAKNKEIVVITVFPGGQETNRKTAGKSGKRPAPTLADYKGSSQIGYEASKAFFIRRALSQSKQDTPLNLDLEWDESMPTDLEFWILKDRRSGIKGRNILMYLENGEFKEH